MDEKISKTYGLTRNLLWSAEQTVRSRQFPLPAEIEDDSIAGHKYILGIYALSKDFLKITSYFLDTSDVSKITFVFDKIDDEIVKKVGLVIKDIQNQPIHVSGFCMKRDKFVYEMYVKGTSEEAAGIVALVQKHASSFQTCIEAIKLEKATRSSRPAGPSKTVRP